jgi:hypothetical protein
LKRKKFFCLSLAARLYWTLNPIEERENLVVPTPPIADTAAAADAADNDNEGSKIKLRLRDRAREPLFPEYVVGAGQIIGAAKRTEATVHPASLIG